MINNKKTMNKNNTELEELKSQFEAFRISAKAEVDALYTELETIKAKVKIPISSSSTTTHSKRRWAEPKTIKTRKCENRPLIPMGDKPGVIIKTVSIPPPSRVHKKEAVKETEDPGSLPGLVFIPSKKNRPVLNIKLVNKKKKSGGLKEEIDLGKFRKEVEDVSYRTINKNKQKNTRLCGNLFGSKKCWSGCNKAHSLEELIKPECSFPRCRYRDTCKFFHKDDDFESWCVRNKYEDVMNIHCEISSETNPGQKIKTQLCNSITDGSLKCRKECTYAHSTTELVLKSCNYGTDCNRKKTCYFQHPGETRNDVFIRLNLMKYNGKVVKY